MSRFMRLLLFASVLLCLFLAASALAFRWVRERTEVARKASLAAKQVQLERTIALLPAGGEWNEARVQTLGQAVGAEIKLLPPVAANVALTDVRGRWIFTHRVPPSTSDPGAWLRVTMTPPSTAQLVVNALQVALYCTVGALAILVAVAIVALFGRRAVSASEEPPLATGAPWLEVSGITQIAKVSAQQGAELAKERTARQLIEGDLHLKQGLLEKAFADKIAMGRDLHDGIVQSLYATGLTLQTARRLIGNKPDQAALQLDAALRTLNATIGEVRGVIGGMTASGLRQAGFRDCVNELITTLAATRAVQSEVRIDDDAAALLDEHQFSECLQVVREAVSNGLRHGAATHLTVRLHRNEGALCLLVQDDGRGFTPEATRERGHGLANMEARAQRLGGALRFQSAPGEGTRIVLTFATSASA